MNLQDFITETLLQIEKGISTADNILKESNAYVAPTILKTENNLNSPYIIECGTRRRVTLIDYDVAVSVINQSDNKNGGSITIPNIASIGKDGVKSIKNQNISRIKFQIPIVTSNCAFEPEEDRII